MNSTDFLLILIFVFLLGVGACFLLQQFSTWLAKYYHYYLYRPKMVKLIYLPTECNVVRKKVNESTVHE